ncbi:protein O-GlcNAcase, partial [Carnobacterium sp.]|uniref:protein O-GlcNAcase n=1 Tax=Carnobacterium sp. TaxID=48221 RepID=UPI003C73F112
MEKLAQKFSTYQEFYTKGEYLFFQKTKITILFSGKFFHFESFQDVFNEHLSSPLFELVGTDYLGQPDMTLSHEFDRNLKPDSFYFTVSKRNHITIKTKNLRGFRYASEVLSLVIEKTTNGTACLIVSLAHEPSFQVRGIIEGFYGTPWKQSGRLDVLHYLGNNRMNTYMYAPKDDLYQRTLWRTLYPDSELAKFEQLVQIAEKEMIHFYYMISPGNDIDYTQVKDIRVLTSKLKQLIDSGIRHFGLLLDDIDYSLKGNAKKKFSSAASAHAYLITQVDTFLKNELEDYSLVVCPTEYDNSHDSAYLEILSAKMPIGIPLFWTGPSTLASQITTADIRKMAHIYNRPMIIWDNIPVNDYQKDYELLFLSPYENRSPLLSQEKYHVLGIVSNPMPQWELSKLTIQTMSQFLWDSSSYKLADSWNKTLAAYLPTDYLSALKLFTAFNPNKYTRAVLTFEQKQAIWNKDIPFITAQLEQLLTASRKLAEVKNDDFQSTIGPWLKRVEQDLTYWDSIKK